MLASVVAIWAAELGSLIEVVNRFGSFFYGSILGVFLLAIGWSRANGTGAFVGLIAGMVVVGYVTVFTLDRVPLAQPDRRGRGVCRRHDRQRVHRAEEAAVGGARTTPRGLMAGRPLLVALLAVIALMVASWTLGEWLRQRKDK